LNFAPVAFVHPRCGIPHKGVGVLQAMAQSIAPDLTATPEDTQSATALPSRSLAGTPDGEDIHADLRYLSHDPGLVNKIMKKRQEELARRSKLLDTKRFRHGVPHDVLDQQIAEKKAAADAIKAQDDYHDRYRVISDQVAQVCETIRHDATRQRQKDVTAYSLENCRKEQRREYHLSDPNVIKTERPTRDGDNDPRLGPSSIQYFEGEDFLAKQRKKEGTASTREFLLYQMARKKEYQDREKQADKLYDEAQITANEVRGLCEKATIEDMKAEKKAEAEENKKIAAMHGARRQAAREKEAQAAQAHAEYEMNSDRLMELADYKLGVDGRLMKGEFKRLSVEEEQGVHNTNAQLLLEKNARRRAEKSGDSMEAAQNFAADMVLHTIEEQKEKAERRRRIEIEKQNKVLAQQKKDFDVLERKAYKSYDHIEPYTSMANLA